MTNEEVLYFLERSEERSPLIQLVRSEHFTESDTLSPGQRRWYANRDAAVGWHLIRACFDRKQPLPKEMSWPAVLRAYRCLEAPDETRRTDPICREVLALGDPINRQEQAMWNGCLCCKLTYEEIATRFGRPVEFVKLYANLFCDFPERGSSPEFVAGVLDPHGERGCFQTDLAHLLRITDPILRSMNIGHWYGPEVLDAERGQVFDGEVLPSETQLLKKARRWLLVRAVPKAIAGSLISNDPESTIIKLLTQQEQQSDSKHQDGTDPETMFARISADKSCQNIIKQVTQQSAIEKVHAGQKYDAEEAAVALKKALEAVAVKKTGNNSSL